MSTLHTCNYEWRTHAAGGLGKTTTLHRCVVPSPHTVHECCACGSTHHASQDDVVPMVASGEGGARLTRYEVTLTTAGLVVRHQDSLTEAHYPSVKSIELITRQASTARGMGAVRHEVVIEPMRDAESKPSFSRVSYQFHREASAAYFVKQCRVVLGWHR